MSDFSYQIKRSSRAASIKIAIGADAKVIVSAPKFMPEFLIKKFVSSQQSWIEANLAKVEKYQSKLKQDEIIIFDKKYLIVINNSADKMGIHVREDKLFINNLSNKTPATIKKQLDEFLKKTALKYIATRTQILAKKMQISYNKLALREQSSRWGSCSSQGNLNFNWRLVHYPPAVIDYVIIHELAHRLELNHSKKFWAIVKKFDSEYLIHKGQLRKRRYN